METAAALVLLLVLLLLPFAAAALAWRMARQSFTLVKQGVRTTGVVTRVEPKRAAIQYSAGGVTYHITTSWSHLSSAIGDEVPVVYPPGSPERGCVHHRQDLWMPPSLWLFVAVLGFGFCFGFCVGKVVLWVLLIGFLVCDACLLATVVWIIARSRVPRRGWGILGAVLFFGGLANFCVFWHTSVRHGGSPSHGKVEDGHFYVMSHGKYTEVPEATWHYLGTHERSTWVTHPLAALGWVLMFCFIRAANAAEAAQKKQESNPTQ